MAGMYVIDGDTLTDIANAIRSQTGESELIGVNDMAAKISMIEGSGLYRDLSAGVEITPGYIASNGSVSPQSDTNKEIVSDYIRIEPGQFVLVIVRYPNDDFPAQNNWTGIGLYDETFGFIARTVSALAASSSSKGYIAYVNNATALENASYIRVSIRTFGSDASVNVIQPLTS